MSKKVGILLIQLGTPDSPSNKDVRRYLAEFLMDPRVIDLPYWKRLLLVRGIIVPFRTPKSAKIYQQLWKLGKGVSPLITHTENVLTLLKQRFENDNVCIELAMRYQNPSLESVLNRMKQAAYDELIIVPMFPQYASASNGSAIEKALSIINSWWVIPQVKVVSHFFDDAAYIDSIVARAQAFDLKSFDKILFSYHGLPVSHVEKVHINGTCDSDKCTVEVNENNRFCYVSNSYATTRLIADKLELNPEQYAVAFQSRLDDKWLTPYSDKVLEQWAKEGVKRVLVFSPAFVADCLETLIEIGDEYQELFAHHGGELVQLVPSSNDHPRFVDCLEGLIRKQMDELQTAN